MRALRWAWIWGLVAACRGAPHDDSSSAKALTAIPTTSTTPTSTPTPSTETPTGTTPASQDAKPTVATAPSIPLDAAAPACRVLRGPIALPLRAPASLALRGDVVDAVINEDGRPRILTFAAVPIAPGFGPVGRELAQDEGVTGAGVPCAVTAEHIFCPDRAGGVHRVTRGRAEDRVVASSRSASRVAAATIGEHVLLAYLASRQTSEGWVSEAWLAADDDPPLRVSEDGSGATSVTLAARGTGALALMIDARTALTAMHARTVAYDKLLQLGEDAVVFVGGPGDRRTRAVLVVEPGGPAWSLLPIARDVASFGLAIVRIDSPPRVDEPTFWSMYPNGLDPAPVAAIEGTARRARPWVARVRPREKELSSPRLLEIGQIGADGTFSTGQVIATTAKPTDVSLAVDALGALWIAWADAGGSWLERLVCR